jgi:hypothetical protein
MVRESEAKKIACFHFSKVQVQTLKKNNKGTFVIEEKRKKQEIFQENQHQTNVPPDVSDQKKKALKETGEDATNGW